MSKEQLADLTQALASQDAALLTPQVNEALAGTALMGGHTVKLAKR